MTLATAKEIIDTKVLKGMNKDDACEFLGYLLAGNDAKPLRKTLMTEILGRKAKSTEIGIHNIINNLQNIYKKS